MRKIQDQDRHVAPSQRGRADTLEFILIRSLMDYTFWLPNGSPEYRYCLHEWVEECNHTVMLFRKWSTASAPTSPRACRGCCAGSPRWFRWCATVPVAFFIGVLAGEEPLDHTQKDVLREGKSLHPIMERVMASMWQRRLDTSRSPMSSSQAVAGLTPIRAILDLAVLPADHAGSVPGDRNATKALYWEEFDIPREVKSELFGDAGYRKWLLQHVRRHADAGL